MDTIPVGMIKEYFERRIASHKRDQIELYKKRNGKFSAEILDSIYDVLISENEQILDQLINPVFIVK